MLFDLRSRRRRTAVRVIYVLLALVMVAGLLLVGVGTGSGGGILNAVGGNNNGNSTGGQSSVIEAQLKKAERAVKTSPNSASAWGKLFEARLENARTGSNVNATTGQPTASGKKALATAATAWNRYLQVDKKPSLTYSMQAAHMYDQLKQWSSAASGWEYAIGAAPASESSDLAKPYLCLTLDSYAAGQTSKGELSAPKALKLMPKLQRVTISSELNSAKKTPKTAQADAAEAC